jgi:atypical dual specificity phosphatase
MPPQRRPRASPTTSTARSSGYAGSVGRLEYTRLHDTLLAGRMPVSERHVEALRSEGVTLVINLCEDREYWDGEREAVETACAGAGIAEHRLPVIDGSTVSADVLERAVEAASNGHVVYVHCRGGRERSATVAIAILAAASGSSVEEAHDRAVGLRPGFKPLPWQVEGVRSWLRERDGRRILDA